jgi:apolipoprotein N-acyltransferase
VFSRFDAIFLSAVLYFLSFPFAFRSENLIPGNLSAAVIWFAFVPLLATIRDASPRDSFRRTYLYGLLANAGVFFWIIIAMEKYGALSIWVSGGIMVLLVLALAVYPAVAAAGTALFRNRAPVWLTGPLFFTLLDWIRVSFPLQGFPWAIPANALTGNLHLVQAADRIGTTGLNLLIYFVNFAIAEGIAARRERRPPPIRLATAAAALFLALFGYGAFQVQARSTAITQGDKIRVALLQGNIPQDLKWEPTEQEAILLNYRDLTLQARSADPDLIVWPEAAVPYTLPIDIRSFPTLAPWLGRADLVTGAPTASGQGTAVTFRNSAFVVAPNGDVRLRYDKQHLVPFGEYVPLSDLLPMHYIVPPVAGNFTAGRNPPLARVRGVPYGILICYEILFPDLTLDFVERGARFLVNITNDAWFDQTSGPYQHVRFGILRAIETRRPIVRAANTGITTWYDPIGRMQMSTRLFTRGFVTAEIAPSTEMTFYVRHPSLVPMGVLLLLLGITLRGWRRRET